MRWGALLTTLALISLSGTVAQAQSGGPWTKNRAIGEGNGVKTGPVVWHPGISTEFGFDSNFLQTAKSDVEQENYGPVVPSLKLRITPQFSVRSLEKEPSLRLEKGAALPPAFMFDISGVASYSEFISLRSGTSMSQLRNLEGGGALELDFLSKRKWSSRVGASYVYRTEPTNQGGGGETHNRHLASVGGGLNWAPGGGRFRWTILEYGSRLTLFDENSIGGFNNAVHSFSSRGSWQFLPKTSIHYGSTLSIQDYAGGENNEGESMQSRLGLSGLITRKLGVQVFGGWAASFYRNQNGVVRNYNGFITQLEAKWFLSADGRFKEGGIDVGASNVTLGFLRDFSSSYIGDFYRRNRLYAQMSYLIGSRVLTTLAMGASGLSYPDFINGGGEQPGFSETRLDLNAFAEYRPLETVGLNLQVRYDVNASEVIQLANSEDDLSFSRFRVILGARWFL